MLRFLSKLARQFQMANTTRTPRRASRRAMPQLEGLEDRLALSTASLIGSTRVIEPHQVIDQRGPVLSTTALNGSTLKVMDTASLNGSPLKVMAAWSGPGDEGPEESITFVYGGLGVHYTPQSLSD
jgi:hypothetical protein